MRLGSGPEIMNESPGFDALFLAFQEAVAGQYSLQRELGRGGMAVVYLARDLRLDRSVAIKLLPPELAAHAKLRDRFMREARTAARLSHPYIVPIHAVDEVAGFVFYVMAYVDGETLAREAQAREGRSAQHPGERPVASLLPLDRERRLRRRDHRFPLGVCRVKGCFPPERCSICTALMFRARGTDRLGLDARRCRLIDAPGAWDGPSSVTHASPRSVITPVAGALPHERA